MSLVASLDEPLAPGRDAVWSAVLGLAADALAAASGHGLTLDEGDDDARRLLDRLDAARASAGDAPPRSFAHAGPGGPAFAEALRRAAEAALGPDAADTRLLERVAERCPEGAVSAYAALADASRFATPFSRRGDRLVFAGAAVEGFGVWDTEEEGAVLERRAAQVIVHDHRDGPQGPELLVQLRAEPPDVEVLLLLVPRPPSLRAGLEALDARRGLAAGEAARLAFDEAFEAPCVAFELERTWTELRGARLRGLQAPLGDVTARVRARLDESGASVLGEAALEALSLPGRSFVFDRPFLLAIGRAGRAPHLACWVETPALLVRAGRA